MSRADEFKTKLQALLADYDAELTMEEGSGYYREYDRMEVWIPAVYDVNGDLVSDSETIVLGTSCSKNYI